MSPKVNQLPTHSISKNMHLYTRSKQKKVTPALSISSLKSSAGIALFPAITPEIYSYSKQLTADTPFLAEAISSPTLLLLPQSWRVQLVIQVVTEALLRTGQGSQWRKRLPPTWTLNVVGNIWLLWAFLFKSEAFPKAYEKVILSVCWLSRCHIPNSLN